MEWLNELSTCWPCGAFSDFWNLVLKLHLSEILLTNCHCTAWNSALIRKRRKWAKDLGNIIVCHSNSSSLLVDSTIRVGNYFPWLAALSQWTWLEGSMLKNVTAFNMLIFFYPHYCWRDSLAGCKILAGRIRPAGRNLPTAVILYAKKQQQNIMCAMKNQIHKCIYCM